MLILQMLNPIKTPLNHHFPMVFLWFSYRFLIFFGIPPDVKHSSAGAGPHLQPEWPVLRAAEQAAAGAWPRFHHRWIWNGAFDINMKIITISGLYMGNLWIIYGYLEKLWLIYG